MILILLFAQSAWCLQHQMQEHFLLHRLQTDLNTASSDNIYRQHSPYARPQFIGPYPVTNLAPLSHYQPIIHNDKYIQGNGQQSNQESYNQNKQLADSGFEKERDYEKGDKGVYEKKDQQSHYNEKDGHKLADSDSKVYYSEGHKAENGKEGGEHFQSEGHKKGSKTTGFHKVYHKDEYKKDHTFYDEADSKGFYEKYGDHHANHGSKAGHHVKGANSEGSYHEDHAGKSGKHEKGHHNDEKEGYEGKSGHENYHNNQENYEKSGGEKESSKQGFQAEDEGIF